MKLNNILSYELFKLKNRKELYIFLFIFIIFPIVFALALGSGTDVLIISGTDKIGGFMFYAFIFSFLASLFIIPITISSLSAEIWSKDISNGTIAYEVLYNPKRDRIFFVKNIIVLVVSLLYNVFLYVVSFLSYKFLASSSKLYTENYFHEVGKDYISFLTIVALYIIFLCSLSTLLSILFSPVVSIILPLFILIVLKIIEQIKVLTKYSLTYILNPINVLEKSFSTNKMIIYFIIIVGLSLLFYGLSYWLFKRKNIK